MLRLRYIDHTLRHSPPSCFSRKIDREKYQVSRVVNSFFFFFFSFSDIKYFSQESFPICRASSKILTRNRSRLIFDAVNRGMLIFDTSERNILTDLYVCVQQQPPLGDLSRRPFNPELIPDVNLPCLLPGEAFARLQPRV